MTDCIKLLPDHVANQIAAGEVVQRPSSVVKELLENAIDAKSTMIQLIVKDSGKTLIQVIDNGSGMSATDARLSFERHATSKIAAADDLFNLQTKGFRGEALASIAAVAQVELKTKRPSDEVGCLIKIEGSKVIDQGVTTCSTGTSIAVKNLFFNIPARRNFLKSAGVEFRHIIDEFHRVALAHEEIKFILTHNNTELFHLLEGNLKQRIVGIFGHKINDKLVPINEDTDLVGVSGFVGKPAHAKRSKIEQFLFVNHRFVKNSYLNHAIENAFSGLLQPQFRPSYFLFLEVDPSTIDINIHPTKTEIKFEDDHSIYAILRAAVKHGLGQYQIAPVLDFEGNVDLGPSYGELKQMAAAPEVSVDQHFNPFDAPDKSMQLKSKQGASAQWESLYVGLQSSDNDQLEIEENGAQSQISAFDETLSIQGKCFQLHRKYIVKPLNKGLLLVHQNRAHQRVLYERILHKLSDSKGNSQQLLFPLDLDMNAQEINLMESLREPLEHIGFQFDDSDNFKLLGIPTLVPESEVGTVLDQLISAARDETPNQHFSQSDLLATSMSKALAIPSGKVLTEEEQIDLLDKLFACQAPNISPDQKSTFSTWSLEDIDRSF